MSEFSANRPAADPPPRVNWSDPSLPPPEHPERHPQEDTHELFRVTRRGKLARLPPALRAELNRRLLAQEPDGAVLAWLNAQAEVRAVLSPYFPDPTISKQNLS